MSTEIMQTITTLELQLKQLKESLSNGTPFVTPKKAKKERDPDAPKKEANVWVKFTQRVGELLKAASAEDADRADHFKGPATMVKSFSSMLKGKKEYDAWEDSEILEAFESWERPAPTPRKKSSDTESVASASSEKKERKKPAPKSDEEKAAISAKRKATIAAKKAGSLLGGDQEPGCPSSARASSVTSTDELIAQIDAIVGPAEPVEKAEKPESAEKPVDKKSFKKRTFTMEQLMTFTEKTIGGEDFGVNERGDVIDDEMKFVGSYNAAKDTIDRSAKEPADWASILVALQ